MCDRLCLKKINKILQNIKLTEKMYTAPRTYKQFLIRKTTDHWRASPNLT